VPHAAHAARRAETQERFAGGNMLPGGGTSPAITAEALEANGWTVQNLAFALESGLTPSGDSLGASMGEIVRHSTRYLSQEDRRAIATYLLDPTSP
jgi:hypothetical protein